MQLIWSSDIIYKKSILELSTYKFNVILVTDDNANYTPQADDSCVNVITSFTLSVNNNV